MSVLSAKRQKEIPKTREDIPLTERDRKFAVQNPHEIWAGAGEGAEKRGRLRTAASSSFSISTCWSNRNGFVRK